MKKSNRLESIKDLHYVVRRLNTRMKELNIAIEDGNAIRAHALAASVERHAKMVANEIEYQSMFNNEEYAEWSAKLEAQVA